MLLALRDFKSVAARDLAEHLRSDGACRNSPLRELLPGLSLIEAPNFLVRLSDRAATPLLRADVGSLKELVPRTPDELLEFSLLSEKAVIEILALMVGEWAAAYLGGEEKDQESPLQRTADASTVLASREQRRRLADAFEEIEAATGFEAFCRRKLDPDEGRSRSEIAADLGLKPGQLHHYERAIGKKLARQMQDEDSPLSTAVAALKAGVRALARPGDLDHALAAIDPLERAMPKEAPQRRALLLLLAKVRVTDDWVVDIEIEEIVAAIFRGHTASGPASLSLLDRHLGRLGVRADLRLPWMASQPGYRIVEGQLMPVGED